ncbi:hypothetical protein D3C71_1470540 [compost metagenome]
MFAFELGPLGHELDHNGRAAHRHHARERQRRLPAHIPHAAHPAGEHQCRAGDHHHRQHHLHQPQAEHLAPHGAQLGQAELQPDGEHQEHHAKLAQVPHPFRVLRQRQRMGANEHPRSQVAEHGWQLEAAADHNTQHCGQQIKQGEGE